MTFDLMTYADRHRYRTRNLHDGRPLHPLRVPVMKRGRSVGYVGEEDREDAIIGYRGYICDDGDGRLGWYIFGQVGKVVQGWLRKLEAAGAVVKQDCDVEAAGDAPVEAIEAVLGIIRPYRVKPPNRGAYGSEGTLAHGLNATASGGVSGHPEAKQGQNAVLGHGDEQARNPEEMTEETRHAGGRSGRDRRQAGRDDPACLPGRPR